MRRFKPPRIFLSDLPNYCLSFYWEEHPDWYIGYRLLEGEPFISPVPVQGLDQLPSLGQLSSSDSPFSLETEPCVEKKQRPPYLEWLNHYKSTNHTEKFHFSFNNCGDNSVSCTAKINNDRQTCEWRFQPVKDGIWMTFKVGTKTALPGVYGLQQCLRFTGGFNEYWRRKVAHTPFLSEFDLQALGQPNRTLSYARQNECWLAFPVSHTVMPTPAGQTLALPDQDGMVDHGLVLRQSINRETAPDWYRELTAPGADWDTISAGMYWERTLFISNRHPADCLHALVDFGPLEPGQSRTVHGKFYWIAGEKDDLLSAWRNDFST